jgi:hypothetical protein
MSLTPAMGRCRPNWAVFGPEHYFWNGFFRWDAGWYQSIVKEGYTFHTDGRASSIVFFPLFPFASRIFGELVGSPWVAGLFLSNGAALAGTVYCYRLFAARFSAPLAERAVWLLLLFPTSLVLSAFYTEGLFFGLTAASVYYFDRRRYLPAGLFGGLAALTRSFGVLLLPAYACELGWRRWRAREKLPVHVAALLVIPAGLGIFMCYQWTEFGDPLAFVHAQRHWGKSELPWLHVLRVLRQIQWDFPQDLDNAQRVVDLMLALVFLFASAYMAWQRFPIAWWVFVLCGVLVTLSANTVAVSTKRYCGALWPAFIALAHVSQDRPFLGRAIAFIFTFLLAVYSLRFLQCGWAG